MIIQFRVTDDSALPLIETYGPIRQVEGQRYEIDVPEGDASIVRTEIAEAYDRLLLGWHDSPEAVPI